MSEFNMWNAMSDAERFRLWMEASDELDALRPKYASAVRTLQDIAAMGKKAGSESAAHRLAQLGEPREAE